MVALQGPAPLPDSPTDELRIPARPRPQSRRRPVSVAAIALCACALGQACGRAAPRRTAPLAPAGSPRDDGRGVLARLSTGDGLERREQTARARRAPRTDAAEATRGVAADDSGTRYANYRFDRSPRPHSAPLPYARRYVPFAQAEFGSIEGVVQWPHRPRAPERAARSTRPDRTGPCAAGGPDQSLVLDGAGGVANAVVYLEDVATGRMLLGRVNSSYPNPTKHMQIGGVLEWRGCRFHPHVQVVAPIGSVLSLTTADEAIQVSAVRVDGRARQVDWTVPLGARGSAHEHLLEREGIFELRADAAGRSASAWVIVAPHPYYALTDDRGRFAIEQVPPGSYTLVVWHEPVVVGFTRSGEPIAQAPPPVRRKVVVRARQGQRVVVKLQPAH